ncbi:MAG: hypothetical protein AAFV95_27355 [Bacteroidota bacterium]
MKNLFLALLLACGLMSFTTASEAVAETSSPVVSYTQVEELEDEDFPCRWRTCVYIDGVKYCTEWQYGECEIQITIR